jgi:ribose 5-phosphate isomerase A
VSHDQSWIDEAKKNAALEAVKHVKPGFVVGLGSGSTAAHAIRGIGDMIKREKMRVLGVPTSYQAFMLAVENKIPVATLEEHPVLDLTIDGADQIDGDLNLIKGMGGALAREKIIASASKEYIIVADENKRVKILGEGGHPVPVEVLPFAVSLVTAKIREMSGEPVVREASGKVGPVITDNGNMIIDARFGSISDPKELNQKLKYLTGVVETGLFLDLVDVVYLGKRSGVEKLSC